MLLKETILIVDDEESIRRFLRIALAGQGYRILEAGSGAEALEQVKQRSPDAVLLDLGLPDLSGVEVTRQLRQWTWIPVVFVSVHDDDRTKVEALDAGADDYLSKPFSLDELMARLRAALRRKHAIPIEGTLSCGLLRLDQDKHQLTVGPTKVTLTPNEFSLLQVLMRNQGKLVSHRQLLTEVWGLTYAEETHMLRVNIFNLRKKIESGGAPRYLVNEPGIGYRLMELPIE